MTYTVKEIYKTIQGEGANTGRVAVFCRFAGCNLWSGREKDRHKAVCKFCDTDFVGGMKLGYEELANFIETEWGWEKKGRFVVFTGGEPLLQLDRTIISALKEFHFYIAVETNGTIAVPHGVDWITVSPKANAPIVQRDGDELKLVYPQPELLPETVKDLWFSQFYLQPMDGPNLEENTQSAIQYCLKHPRWRLSLQTHKFVGLP